VTWPGSADAVRADNHLKDEWRRALGAPNEDGLRSTLHTRWPMEDRPFSDIVGWLTASS
jgi:hypothetical protein